MPALNLNGWFEMGEGGPDSTRGSIATIYDEGDGREHGGPIG